MSAEVRPLTTTARPTAVLAATTTWQEFPSLWGRLLDQVYECLAAIDSRHLLHNVMLYKDDLPTVEVGVEVHVPFTPTGDVVVSALPARSSGHGDPSRSLRPARDHARRDLGMVQIERSSTGRSAMGDLRGLAREPIGAGD